MKTMLHRLVIPVALLSLIGCARMTMVTPTGATVTICDFLDSSSSVNKVVVRTGTNGTETIYVGGATDSASSTGVVSIINALGPLIGTAMGTAAATAAK